MCTILNPLRGWGAQGSKESSHFVGPSFEQEADMVELADTPDLGSGAQACRFKSCYPQYFMYHPELSRDIP